MARWTAALAALLGGIVLAILGTTPQPPRSDGSDPAIFSGTRPMAHVRVIAAEPHPTGSAQNARVRAYLIAEMQKLGMEVSTTTGAVPKRSLDRFAHWSGTRPDALTLTNVIGILPGSDRSLPAVALMAHHDTVWESPGAPDDTAGIASVLETVRAIKAEGPLTRDVIAIMTDGEELGLLGARQFFGDDGKANPISDRIGAIINLEARGGGGRTTLFQTSARNGQAVALYSSAVDRPGGSSLATFVYDALPNDTDLTPALKRDYAAYNLSFIGRSGLYHSPKATPANLDQGALQDMGDQTLALTWALGNADALPQPSPNITFFDMFGIILITYGAVTGWVLFAVMAALHIYCLRSNSGGLPGALRSLGASAAVILGGGLLLYGLNVISGAASSESDYYDRLAAIPMLTGQALLICIAALAATAPLWAGRSGSIVGVLIALVLQIYAPVTSYITVWPFLLSGIAGALDARFSGRWVEGVKAVCGALSLGFVLQYGFQLMQGVGPDVPWVTAVLAALMVPMLGAMIPPVSRKPAFTLAAICLAGASAIALWVRLDPVADTVAAYESMKG
ncbi:M28 family peptidase [Pontixanthobacter sp.]|uniref:M28 family peptidase n=1 Tax=Pontixanthobacter sp. TaxID=2792078 RepID=UPI003C79C6CE